MAKKTKSESATEVAEAPVSAVTASQKKKAVKSTKASSKKTAAKKTSAPKSSRTSRKAGAKPAQTPEPSDADIRLRAYFIAERRVQLALQGDPGRDWLEAKQQLLEEARQARS